MVELDLCLKNSIHKYNAIANVLGYDMQLRFIIIICPNKY